MPDFYDKSYKELTSKLKWSVELSSIGAAVDVNVATIENIDESGNLREGQGSLKTHLALGDIIEFTYPSKKIRVLPKVIPESMQAILNPIVVFTGWDNNTGRIHGINLRQFVFNKNMAELDYLFYKIKQNYYKPMEESQAVWIKKDQDEQPAVTSSQSFRYENFETSYNMVSKILPKYYRSYDVRKMFMPTIINILESELAVKKGQTVVARGKTEEV